MLVVGLGNPGKEYLTTRHNLGFLALDQLAERLELKSWRPLGDALVLEGFARPGGQTDGGALLQATLPPAEMLVEV